MPQASTIEQLRDRLAPVFIRHGVRKATVFGSHSKGTARPSSDVDLLVDSGLRGLAFFGLLEDVAECMDCEVDLIDISQITPTPQLTEKSGVQGSSSMSNEKDRTLISPKQGQSSCSCLAPINPF